jgi:hypothetical protein
MWAARNNKTSSVKLQRFISHHQQQRTGDDVNKKKQTPSDLNEMQRSLIDSMFNDVHSTHFLLESIYVLNNSDIKVNGISFSFMRSRSLKHATNTMFAFYLFQFFLR